MVARSSAGGRRRRRAARPGFGAGFIAFRILLNRLPRPELQPLVLVIENAVVIVRHALLPVCCIYGRVNMPAAMAVPRPQFTTAPEPPRWPARNFWKVPTSLTRDWMEARSIRPPDWPERARTRNVSACGPAAMALPNWLRSLSSPALSLASARATA